MKFGQDYTMLVSIYSLNTLGELPNKKSDIFEAHRRYLKALDLIKSKYEKRIYFLALEEEKMAIVLLFLN